MTPRKTHDTTDYLALAHEIMKPVSVNEKFERDAAQFFAETGKMAPGKDVPAALGNTSGIKASDEEFSEWRRENNRKRVAEQAELIRLNRIKMDLRVMILSSMSEKEVPENHFLDVIECTIDTDEKTVLFKYELIEMTGFPDEDEEDASR
jgi:hypothetical protein